MKTSALLLLLLLVTAASAAELPKWMSGSWFVDTEGAHVEEHWTTGDGGMMIGMGKTVTQRKSTFEFIRIVDMDGTLAYIAMPQARPETTFRQKMFSESRIVFENLEHDYPQRVLYWRDGEKLCARVEGLLRGKLEGEEWCYTRNP